MNLKKSVYSLVLTDEVIAEVDRAAYERGTSRSNLVNQILADYVSYLTPEKRMRDVFSALEKTLIGDTFQMLLQPSDSMFSLRSMLDYKYNPTIRYSVELYPNTKPLLGELRVSFRSQNSTLLLYLLQFFKLWERVENSYIGQTDVALQDGRYARKLVLRGENADETTIGKAIAAYIELFDTALKVFFANLYDSKAAIARVDALYADYLHSNALIV